MNANELAKLLFQRWNGEDVEIPSHLDELCAEKLQQQAGEIEKLKETINELEYVNGFIENKPVALKFPTMLRKMWSGGEVQAWLDELPLLYANPAELTDEEIIEVHINTPFIDGYLNKNLIDFARAILRKASEK